MGKSSRQPFLPSKTKRTTDILQVVHSDLAGPLQNKSIQGSIYIATFLGDYSKYRVLYFMKSKDQFQNVFKMYLAWAETQTSLKMRALHSDRGGEYMVAQVKDILAERGIEHHLTMPGSPLSNGKLSSLTAPLKARPLLCCRLLACLKASRVLRGVLHSIYTIALPPVHLSGVHLLRSGTLAKYPTSHTCASSVARGTCMCLLTSVANLMRRPLRSCLLGTRLMPRAISSGIGVLTLKDCPGM